MEFYCVILDSYSLFAVSQLQSPGQAKLVEQKPGQGEKGPIFTPVLLLPSAMSRPGHWTAYTSASAAEDGDRNAFPPSPTSCSPLHRKCDCGCEEPLKYPEHSIQSQVGLPGIPPLASWVENSRENLRFFSKVAMTCIRSQTTEFIISFGFQEWSDIRKSRV